jgi:hypothetical protein
MPILQYRNIPFQGGHSKELVMAYLILVRGLPSKAKHDWAHNIAYGKTHGSLIYADSFFLTPSGKYEFKPHLLPDAHKSCGSAVANSLITDYNSDTPVLDPVVINNTFCTAEEMNHYIWLGECFGRKILIVDWRCTVEECLADNFRSVPVNALQRMDFLKRRPLPKEWWGYVVSPEQAENLIQE